MPHRLTWLAIIVTFVLLMPGEMLGYLVATFYRWAMTPYLEGNLIFDYLTGGWGAIIMLEGFSGVVQGVVAALLAAHLTAKFIRRADYIIVAYTDAALVIAFTLLGFILGVAKVGLRDAAFGNGHEHYRSRLGSIHGGSAHRQRAEPMKALVVGLLLVTAFCKPASAFFDTEQLQSVCQEGLQNPSRDNPKFAMCTGLMIGMLMTDALEKSVICLPSNVDTQTALRVFIARAVKEPHKDIDGTVTLFRALSERYPCPPK